MSNTIKPDCKAPLHSATARATTDDPPLVISIPPPGGARSAEGGVPPRTHSVLSILPRYHTAMSMNQPTTAMFRKWCNNSKAEWVSRLTMTHFLQMFQYGTPFFQTESQRNRAQTPYLRRDLRYLRRYAWLYPDFAQVVLHEGFGVAPKAWPQVIREAFPTDDPPSPYDCACAFVREPSPRFWSLSTYRDEIAVSALYWYLIGAHPQAIANALDITTPALYKRLATLFLWALGRGKLVIWALSTDTTPIITNQNRAKALAALYRGDPLSKWLIDSRNTNRIYDSIAATPYIQAQLKARRAIKPIPRPIYHPGFVFETIEDKRAWESTDSMDTRWLARHRTQLIERTGGNLHSWTRLPLRVPVYDRNDPEVQREIKRRSRKRKEWKSFPSIFPG